jgi:hypothetical protein
VDFPDKDRLIKEKYLYLELYYVCFGERVGIVDNARVAVYYYY